MRSALTTLLALSAATVLLAQSAEPPAFEVASVKWHSQPIPTSGRLDQVLPLIRTLPGGRVTTERYPLRSLISWSYGLNQFELADGGPAVLDERFDITAQGPADAPPVRRGEIGILQRMMQTLLADRFKLRLTRAERVTDVLVLTRLDDSKLAPGLRPSTVDCRTVPPPRPAPGNPACGFAMINGALHNIASIADITRYLTAVMEKPVLDRTGLEGHYEVRTAFNPSDLPAMTKMAALTAGRIPTSPSTDQPSLYTAFRQDLGLKLDAQRLPMTVTVVEYAERPAEN